MIDGVWALRLGFEILGMARLEGHGQKFPRGQALLEEKQLKFHIERYGSIAHLWSSYAVHSDGKQVARGMNSIQAIKEAGGWRVTSIVIQAESASAPLPKKYLP